MYKRQGKKELKFSRDTNARHEPSCGGGEKSLLCDPGSELRLGGRGKRRAKIIDGMEIKKKKLLFLYCSCSCSYIVLVLFLFSELLVFCSRS